MPRSWQSICSPHKRMKSWHRLTCSGKAKWQCSILAFKTHLSPIGCKKNGQEAVTVPMGVSVSVELGGKTTVTQTATFRKRSRIPRLSFPTESSSFPRWSLKPQLTTLPEQVSQGLLNLPGFREADETRVCNARWRLVCLQPSKT